MGKWLGRLNISSDSIFYSFKKFSYSNNLDESALEIC